LFGRPFSRRSFLAVAGIRLDGRVGVRAHRRVRLLSALRTADDHHGLPPPEDRSRLLRPRLPGGEYPGPRTGAGRSREWPRFVDLSLAPSLEGVQPRAGDYCLAEQFGADDPDDPELRADLRKAGWAGAVDHARLDGRA